MSVKVDALMKAIERLQKEKFLQTPAAPVPTKANPFPPWHNSFKKKEEKKKDDEKSKVSNSTPLKPKS